MTIPRIMIAGTNSGVGKTTITLSIMAALTKMGHNVQSFKVGPDYIDPSYHSKVTGNPSINLDTKLTSTQIVKESFQRYCTGKTIAIIEGVMGLFDGYEGETNRGSSAEIANIINCPVILVIDAKSMARSAAAVAAGFVNFDPNLRISGLIINNVGSYRHKRLLEGAFKDFPIPVIGYLMRNNNLKLSERHLGLIPLEEKENIFDDNIFAQQVTRQVDINKLINLARKVPPADIINHNHNENDNVHNNAYEFFQKQKTKVKIAVAKDAAFNFYYWDGLKYLEELGAELVWFSPLTDQKLPKNTNGIIIGGGFPELFLPQLAENKSLHEEIRKAYLDEMPIYAECGGYMYLCIGIYSFEEDYHPMVNLIPSNAVMGKKLAGMGYRSGYLSQNSVLGVQGDSVTGHEFHYSTLTEMPEDFSWAFQLYNPRQEKWINEGFASKNLLASYLHIHWRGLSNLTARFVKECENFRRKKYE